MTAGSNGQAVTGVRRAGDRSAVLDVDGEPAAVARAIRSLAQEGRLTLTDVVPGAATVLVTAADRATLGHLVTALPALITPVPGTSAAAAIIEIAVTYDGADLDAVARITGLSVADVIRLHAAPTYRAAFTGFAPGFAYLSGLDEQLRMPRRESPRPAVPAGSVAIADTYSAIYPRASPGGWQLLGTTDIPLFDPARTPPALIEPGTRVRFVPRTPGQA